MKPSQTRDVLGTPAFRGEAMANNVANAQREAARAPELAGTVAAVESWPLTTPEVAIWRMKKDAARGNGVASEIERAEQQWPLYGSNQGYHYDGSGRFFIVENVPLELKVDQAGLFFGLIASTLWLVTCFRRRYYPRLFRDRSG